MQRVYFYKLTSDNGGAPCVQDSLLSLAICKPMIRSTAKDGDLIFGFAANSLYSDNCLIYIAWITEKVPNGHYYCDTRFAAREDCVYEKRGQLFIWRPMALHHGPENLVHDLGSPPDYPKAKVLLSTEYRYFGSNGTSDYKTQYPEIKRAVERLGQGHRVAQGNLRLKFFALAEQVWREVKNRRAGTPGSGPCHGGSHRSRSCGF